MIAEDKRLVAIVDSNDKHRQQVEQALMSFYDIVAFGDAVQAVETLSKNPPIMILAGEKILPGSCVDFINVVREEEALRNVPIILIADANNNIDILPRAKQAGITDYISKPYLRSTLIKTISQYLNAGVEEEWEALNETPRAALKNTIAIFHDISDVLMTGEALEFQSVKSNCQPLVEAIENNDFNAILDGVRHHDDYTYAHSMRVATMLTLLGHAAGFKNDEQLLLASGGLLHDVGKMNIPHHILNKPGKLSEEEFEIMKSHVPETMAYLDKTGHIPKGVLVIAEQHHEKIDGTGYPNGLKGAELNELARMAAVVDVFSALTDRRVYKPPMETAKAMQIMSEEMTNHLDQNYVKMFRSILGDSGILE